MKNLKITFVVLAIAVGVVATGALLPELAAAAPSDQIQQGVNAAGGAGETPLTDRIKDIVNIMLFVLGAIAVIMIVIGGIRYAVSGGDSSSVKGAKDTILYAVVGLIVAILAYAIVNFVVGSFK